MRHVHWEVLLICGEESPQLVTNRFSGFGGRATGAALWQNIATKLNSVGFGEKGVDEWRNTVADWKGKTKSTASALKREQQQTGGGPPQLPPLSQLEDRLLLIMGTKALEGDEVVPYVHDSVHDYAKKNFLWSIIGTEGICLLPANSIQKRSPLEKGLVLFDDRITPTLPKEKVVLPEDHVSPKFNNARDAGVIRHNHVPSHSHIWIPGSIKHHLFIPPHVAHISTPRIRYTHESLLKPHYESDFNTRSNSGYFGNYGVGFLIGGHGTGHGFHVIFQL